MPAYIAIDLKSFYASAECREKDLDPLDACLVVADESRTEKTICLAVSPALKSFGIPGRARLFEVIEKVRAANALRRMRAPGGVLRGKSRSLAELQADPSLEIDFHIAKPRMAHYMQVSTRIYDIYLRFVAPEDIHVYSIDEVFIDATRYLRTYGISARELAMRMIRAVLAETGITATAGIGTNLYLCKVAMDIVAKHIPADADGVRIAELDEMSYRRELWTHTPITDFWRVGRGIAAKLRKYGICTMGDIARRSLTDEQLLFDLFGVNAELLIDHAWGIEPCTMEAIHGYEPESSSLSLGQVLPCPYSFENGRLIVREMTDQLVLELVEKRLTTDRMVLTVCYDRLPEDYKGKTATDFYGREVPKEAHGTADLGRHTSSTREILQAVSALYDRIVDPSLEVRRMYVVAANTQDEEAGTEQLDLFTDYSAQEREREKEKRRQQTLIDIKKKFGRNAILRGMDLQKEATARERNRQVGGHQE